MEWIQRPNSESLGTDVQLFTHKIGRLQDLYHSPEGFEFDITEGDPPFIGDQSSPDFNADLEAVKFDKVLQAQAALFATDYLFVLMGQDFAYMDAF